MFKYKIVDNLKFYPNIKENKDLFPNYQKFKKYMVKYNSKKIFFGDKRYQQYEDKIGFFEDKDHLDKKRRTSYRKRHQAILNRDGKPAYKVKGTPSYFSYNYLW